MGMDPKKHTLLWVGISLIIVSAGLLALGLIPGLIERSEPAIIFLSLAAVFVFTMLAAPGQWRWRPALWPSARRSPRRRGAEAAAQLGVGHLPRG